MTRPNRPSMVGEFRAAAGQSDTTSKQEPTPAPFSLRLTLDERQALEREAGHQSLGAYIRAKLFDDAERQRRRHRKPLKDDQALAKLLGALGESRLANNLNQLAKAANTGSLPITRSQRGGSQQLAVHLLKTKDNEHAEVHVLMAVETRWYLAVAALLVAMGVRGLMV
jgi:hypothetical protein